ncbi:MAG: hypothetical protein K6A38_04470 [Lachnospiraceae bacterium]|nr:hypothetical protein [Lachnospiraceae bacterium]
MRRKIYPLIVALMIITITGCGKKETGWQYAYSGMINDLLDGETVAGVCIDTSDEYLADEDWCPMFRLYDLNNDDIPELFLALQPTGEINVYTYSADSDSVIDTGLTVGYETSGSVRIYPLIGSDYFITGPAFSEDTILYELKDGKAKQLLEYGEPDGSVFMSESLDDEISEDEFRSLLDQYLGVEFNTSLFESVRNILKEDISDMSGYAPLTDLVDRKEALSLSDADLSGVYVSESVGETGMKYENYISVDLVKDQSGQYRSMCMISREGGTTGYFDVKLTDGAMKIDAGDSPVKRFDLEPYGSGYMIYSDDNHKSILLIRSGDADGTWWDE